MHFRIFREHVSGVKPFVHTGRYVLMKYENIFLNLFDKGEALCTVLFKSLKSVGLKNELMLMLNKDTLN